MAAFPSVADTAGFLESILLKYANKGPYSGRAHAIDAVQL
jgi:hypothetical protein